MIVNREIWVFCEHRDGQIARVSAELLGKAVDLNRSLETKVVAILIGGDTNRVVPQAAAYGADKIYSLIHPGLKLYQNDAYAQVMADAIRMEHPEIVLFGSTETGDDLAPRVAAKIGTGLTSHCVGLRIENLNGTSLLFQTVPAWGGSKRIDIICPNERPQMATVKPGTFDMPTEQKRPYEHIRQDVELSDKLFRARVLEENVGNACELSIEDAEVVVAAGWGVCAAGAMEKVKQLSEVMCGTLGATRPVIDKDILPENRMIGQSGKIVHPKLFFSLGASGATHFTTGFEKASYILAVDQNPRAAIFDTCDIGIVGDLNAILPLLIDELKGSSKIGT